MRDLDIGSGVIVPAHLLRAVTSRSGGPGGQNVNKLETKVTIELPLDSLTELSPEQREAIGAALAGRINRLGILRVTSQAGRSQLENRDIALSRMERLLADALEVRAPRKATKVSRAAKKKRLEQKKRISEKKRARRVADRD